jgi:hypothetical protein
VTALPSSVQLEDGRTFELRDLDPGDMLDLIEAAGSASASSAWMRYAVMICSVRAISGKPIMMPRTKQAIRELAVRIGNEGVDALYEAHYPGEIDERQELETAKN